VHINILNLVKAEIAKVFTAAAIPAPQPAIPASPAPLTIVASTMPNTPPPPTNSDKESNDTKLQVKKEKSPKNYVTITTQIIIKTIKLLLFFIIEIYTIH
jgi:hypothetical protein